MVEGAHFVVSWSFLGLLHFRFDFVDFGRSHRDTVEIEFRPVLASTVSYMDIRHLIGALIALATSARASFVFFRGSITGAPPLYSKGWLQRGLHVAAGIIFAALAIGMVLKIAGRW